MGERGAQSVERSLALLLHLIDDGGRSSLATIGRDLGLAPATSYRLAGALRRSGLIIGIGKGRVAVGPALASRHEQLTLRTALKIAARPILQQLAGQAKAVGHVGVLDSEMVSYLVREGADKERVFSEEDTQLEAYCSGIGKVLLANLPTETRESYLSAGPFVALTERTITDPAQLRIELAKIAEDGFALDRGEAAPDVYCLAIPIRDPSARVFAAISISRSDDQSAGDRDLGLLLTARDKIERIFSA